MSARLDFSRFSLRSGRGGYVSRCKGCGQEKNQLAGVVSVAQWQAAHHCQAEVLAALTRETATLILAAMTPDPIGHVLQRRDDLEGAVRAHRAVAS